MAQQMEQKDRTIQMLNEQIALRPRPSITTIETRNSATQTDKVYIYNIIITINDILKIIILFIIFSVDQSQLQHYAHSIEKDRQMAVL